MEDDASLRILIADSDPRVRSALQRLLQQTAGSVVLRECADVGGLANEVRGFQPHLVLLDWELPGRPAAALLFALQELEIRPRVIVLSTRPESGEEVLAAGADAFVSKADPPEQLLRVIRELVPMPTLPGPQA